MNLEERDTEYAAALASVDSRDFEVVAALRRLNIGALARIPAVALIGDFATLLAFTIAKLPTQTLRDSVLATAIGQITDAANDKVGRYAALREGNTDSVTVQ